MGRFKHVNTIKGGVLAIHKLGKRYQEKLMRAFGSGATFYTNLTGNWLAILNSSDAEVITKLHDLFLLSETEDKYSESEVRDMVDKIKIEMDEFIKFGKVRLITWTKVDMKKYDSRLPEPKTEKPTAEPITEIKEPITEEDDEEELSKDIMLDFDDDDESDILIDETLSSTTEEVEIPPLAKKKELADALNSFYKFFTEVSFKPSVRMVDTLCRTNKPKDGADYISNYLELINHPDKDIITPKLKSIEFYGIYDTMICTFSKIGPTNPINNRLEIWYGPNGTGKTHSVVLKYQKDYPDIGVMACSSSMSSQEDLLQVFDFLEGGKPVFKDSVLTEAIRNDRPVILEEARLMQQSCFAFLQNLLDSKDYVDTCRGRLRIGPKFKVIMTLNLEVNGIVYELPEPIVDRAQVIVKKDMDADLAATIIWNRKEVK